MPVRLAQIEIRIPGHGIDNCVDVHNYNQLDTDDDGKGDACDDDIDNDGIPNEKDNCPLIVNYDQETSTISPNKGVKCQFDSDGDGIPDAEDACPINKKIGLAKFYSTQMRKIDLCKHKLKGKRSKKKNTFCVKEAPRWVDRKNGTQLYQAINSRPSIAINEAYDFEGVEYNGTIYIDDTDNDWIGFVFGYVNIFNFYIVMANKWHDQVSQGKKMWWHLKKIYFPNAKGPESRKPYDGLLNNLQVMKDRKGSKTLWEDPRKQFWVKNISMKYSVRHEPDKEVFNLFF